MKGKWADDEAYFILFREATNVHTKRLHFFTVTTCNNVLYNFCENEIKSF
jgi:hypothetical protein